MPRRNSRVNDHQPLDATPVGGHKKRRPPAELVHNKDNRAIEAFFAKQRAERAEAQLAARVNGAIDWSVCLVPGCGEALVKWDRLDHGPGRRDSSRELPMCYLHAAVIWHRALGSGASQDPQMQEAIADLREAAAERTAANEAAIQAEFMARTDGDIYFVRLNNLVKVGWTRQLHERIKSYGASAEVLVYYPGTRDDETTLHRQLRPALARGREWYEDGPIIARFVEDALRQHGEPTLKVFWTKPKQVVAGKRHR